MCCLKFFFHEFLFSKEVNLDCFSFPAQCRAPRVCIVFIWPSCHIRLRAVVWPVSRPFLEKKMFWIFYILQFYYFIHLRIQREVKSEELGSVIPEYVLFRIFSCHT